MQESSDSCLKLNKMKEITIKQQLKQVDNLMEMIAISFKNKLNFELSIDKDFYNKPTDELLKISDPNVLYATVMGDKYWLQVWSDLLFLILFDELNN